MNQECSISIHNLNSRNIYISSDFHAKIGNFSRFIVYNQMVPFPTNTTSSYFDDLFPNIFPPEEHDSVISREDQHSFHIRPLQQARDVYYFGVIMFECFTRRKFSQSEKIDSSISWLPRSLRNILISCLQPNVSLRPSFSKLISVLGELLICSEVELFQNYDLPRILNYLKSDSTHLQLLAAKEIFTLGGEHGRCYRCGHMSNAQFFGQRLCDAGALQTLSDLLFASTTNVSKACVIAISSLLSIESISRGRLRMKYLGQISSSNSIKTLLNLVSSIDRDVSRSARNVLVIISQNTELSSEMVFSLNQKMANRFLQELHGDITSVKQQIEAFQKELKLKEERLERYEQSLADTTQFKLRDKYDISVEIGSGAFSSVFYCKNKISGKRCAVKSIDLDKISQFSSFNYGKLEEEFNIMSALIHPNIITMEEFFLENRTLHLIMELAEFGDLFDYLVDKKRLRESDARRISKDILNAIAYLHSMGILHRDLKPANILLTGDEHKPIIKLADFGFAKFQKNDAEDSVFSLKHLKRAHSELGTIGYAAPEIFDGGVYDERVDIWSFGIILHIMLCGYPPYCDIRRHEETGKLLVDNTPFWTHFQRMKLPVLSNEVLSDNDPLTFESEYWKEISSEAKDLVTQCLQINQRKRPVASQCLEHPWFSLDMGYPKLPPEKMKELESKLKFKTLDDIIKDRSFF